MYLRLLGSIEALDGSATIALGGRKERATLAVLAMSANELVSADRLIHSLWGDSPPRTALKTLQVHLSRLRKVLSTAATEPFLSIQTRPTGYLLRAPSGTIDVVVVEELLKDARSARANGDHQRAAELLSRALGYFHGRPLGEFADEPFAAGAVARLGELHLVVTEERVDAELACGRHLMIAGELEGLTEAHPMRERLWGQRMLALYRAGRQVEALRVYQELRRTLGEEVGIEPSPAIKELEQAIINQSPDLGAVEGSTTASTGTTAPQSTTAPGTMATATTPTEPATMWAEPVQPVSASERRAQAQRLPSGVVTFLLSDIEGSTTLWEINADAMAAALEKHDRIIEDRIDEAGGVLIKSKGEGDSTLSVFPSATNAVAAAVQLQRAFATETWPGELELRVRIAVHTGEAFGRDGDYYGPTLNRAARIRGLGNGGQVLLSRATAEIARHRLPEGVTVRDSGYRELRGSSKSELISVLEIAGVGERPPRPQPRPGRPPRPERQPDLSAALIRPSGEMFVGRDGERERLHDLWQQACTGDRRAVLIAGEAGIGKTRLAAELAGDVHQAGARVLYGRCSENLGFPYQPFVEVLRTYLAACPDEALFTEGLALGELARLVPELAERTGVVVPPRGDPELDRSLMFDACCDLMAQITATGPALVVLDDLQWATKPTLLLLLYLLSSSRPMATLILGLYRDADLARTTALAESLTDLRRHPAVERMTVRGLSVDEVATLTEAAGAGRAARRIPRTLIAALHSETDGNPFFLRELLIHLNNQGALNQTGLASISLPETVRDAITRRLDHLSRDTNRALSVAAVAGSTFSLRLLEAVPDAARDPDELLDALDEAVNARVILEDPDEPGRYSFAHNLIRHALLAELTTARRTRMHRRIGEAIEALPDRERQVEALAYHFAEAALDNQVNKAARYSLDAGRYALQRLAFEEAASWLERGVTALELEDDDHRDRAALANLLLVLAEARAGSGDTGAARQLSLRAAAEARSVGSVEQLSKAAIVYARLVPFNSPNQSVVDLCNEALAALGDRSPGMRARVLAALGHHRARADGDYEAAGRLAEEAAQLAEMAEDPSTEADALVTRIEVLIPTPDVRQRLALAGQLLNLGRRSGDVRIRASGLYHEALARLVTGDFNGFDRNIAEIERLASRLHLLSPLEVIEDFGTMRALLVGRFKEAEAMIETGLAAELSADSERTELLGGQLLVLYHELGRLDEMAPLVMAAARAQPSTIAYRAGAMLVLAELGRHTEARPEFEHVMTTCEAEGLPQDITRVILILELSETAALLGIAERADQLYGLFEPYRGQFSMLSYVACYGSVDRHLGMLSALAGRWDQADEHFKAGLAMEEAAGALPLAVRTNYWYGRSLLARGDDDRAEDVLTATRRQADDLGMAGLVRQIDELARPLAG